MFQKGQMKPTAEIANHAERGGALHHGSRMLPEPAGRMPALRRSAGILPAGSRSFPASCFRPFHELYHHPAAALIAIVVLFSAALPTKAAEVQPVVKAQA